MITKEQALTWTSFIQVSIPVHGRVATAMLVKPINWRANGKCKVWKTRPDDFKLPIKHGLYTYTYGYITQDNCHLFNVAG